MKKTLVISIVLLFPLIANSQSIVFLDEGINTNQPLSAPDNVIAAQRCRSLPTLTRSANGTVPFVSLCANGQGFHYGIDILNGDVPTAAQYENRQTFTLPDFSNGGAQVNVVVEHERPTDGHPLRHGNYVSNAAWAFTRDLFHVPFIVFGINRVNSPQSVVTSLRGNDIFGLPEEPIGQAFERCCKKS